MSRMFPAVIDPTASAAEKEVFQRLRDGDGTEEWIVLHSLWISRHAVKAAGECDFVVLIPDHGVICLEVKGCTRLRRENGIWYYGPDTKGDSRGPFRQASEAMYSIRRRVLEMRPDLQHLLFTSMVIFPFVEFRVLSDEWHEWQIIDGPRFRSKSLVHMLESVCANARRFLESDHGSGRQTLRFSQMDKNSMKALLTILRSDFDIFAYPSTLKRLREDEVKKFTEEQFEALDLLESNPRVVFTGPAGTGKTLLAIEAAKRARAQKRRVLFVCYNRLLGAWLRSIFAPFEDIVTVATLHKQMLQVAGLEQPPADADDDFWKHRLADLCLEQLCCGDEVGHVYDELVVDEIQDLLHSPYLDFLDLSLRGGLSSGRWRFFGDFEKQMIFSSPGSSLDSSLANRGVIFSSCKLRVNCRNTPNIAFYAKVLGGLNPDYKRIRRPMDPINPKLLYYRNETMQTEQLVQALADLTEEGFSSSDIVVLSPKAVEACAAGKLDQSPWREKLRPFGQQDGRHLRYTSIHSFKGLEASAIVVTDVDALHGDHMLSLFYIAVTRALHRLVLILHESTKQDIFNLLRGETGRAESGGHDG